MPFEYAWRPLVKDCSEIELEVFLDRQKRWKKKSSNATPCTVCPLRLGSHNMRYVIYQCRSSSCRPTHDAPECEWYVRSVLCEMTKRGSIDQHGAHNNGYQDPPLVELNLTMKRFIRDQTLLKKTPSRILNAMIDNGMLSDNAHAYWPFVQRFSYYFKTTRMHDNNNVDEMEALLASRPYHEALHETTAFAFGYECDGGGNPALTRGSVERPVHFSFTSKCLRRNLAHAKDHVLHIDATFKLNTARFPAVVIGVSDTRHQFHPVTFFITSDLRQAQVVKIVRAVLHQYEVVTGTKAVLGFVMADADVAQRNANVKKYLSTVPSDDRPLIFKHVYRIHYARSPEDFDTRIEAAVSAWRQQRVCEQFERHFSQQWLQGRFTRWQCLWTPPGFAKTNNPLEQFNKEINRDYSLRSQDSVNSLAQSFLDMCHHRASRAKTFATAPPASDEQARRYRTLQAAQRLAVTSVYRSSIAFMTVGADRRVFRVFQSGVDGNPQASKSTSQVLKQEATKAEQAIEVDGEPSIGWDVDVDAGTCNCRSWFKFGFCSHLIASRLHLDMAVEGMVTKRKFVNKNAKEGKGKRAKVGHALALA